MHCKVPFILCFLALLLMLISSTFQNQKAYAFTNRHFYSGLSDMTSEQLESASNITETDPPVKEATHERAAPIFDVVTGSRPGLRYPVNMAPAGKITPKVESAKISDGNNVTTIIGRFYLWQKQDEQGGLLEFQADNAVIWHGAGLVPEKLQTDSTTAGYEDVSAIYVSGDVVMTFGQRTIRADQIYYDFKIKKALAINASMRNFDTNRGIPIYVRAAKLRQIAENKFNAEDVTLTTSEFYLPQISLSVSDITITDMTLADEQKGSVTDSSYDAQMRDVLFKMYDTTLFYWPYLRCNLQRPDIPLRGISIGYDSTWGGSIETRWYLARLLGLREPEETNSTFALDYYGERGLGTGFEIDYQRENYYGRILGYGIYDSGLDQLGRDPARKDLLPPHKLRGRFRFQHRHFLPYNWQLTTEAGYLSDENFLEQYYRNEFYVGKEQETLIHIKRIEDNWALAFLGKTRINDFMDTVEELPSAEFHLTGQSLFNDMFTFYSDSQVNRFRHSFGSTTVPTGTQEFFTFMTTRNELDMPLSVGRVKVVPFVAGTLGYEDGAGFYTDIDGSAIDSENRIWIGEAGLRVSAQPYWKVYPNIKSRLWDLNQLRHIIKPQLTAIAYSYSDLVVQQRDVFNLGISQRLQTKRGIDDKQRTVDWMRLDLDFTWVANPDSTLAGADRFIWNTPSIPLVNSFSTVLPPQDRRSSDIFGPRRNYFGADFIWQLSDTTSLLTDMNFDMQTGILQQFNIGFSRLVWPDLSYYIGSRYLKRIMVPDEKALSALTFALTYELDPRYTMVFSQQYDFESGANIRSDLTLIRRYHRVYFGVTFSVDESLDQHSVIFSLWPEGVPELAIGLRRYMGLGSSVIY